MLIDQLRLEKGGGSYAPLRVILAGDREQELEMQEECLIEDSSNNNQEFSYSDFLHMLHKLIRSKNG